MISSASSTTLRPPNFTDDYGRICFYRGRAAAQTYQQQEQMRVTNPEPLLLSIGGGDGDGGDASSESITGRIMHTQRYYQRAEGGEEGVFSFIHFHNFLFFFFIIPRARPIT